MNDTTMKGKLKMERKIESIALFFGMRNYKFETHDENAHSLKMRRLTRVAFKLNRRASGWRF